MKAKELIKILEAYPDFEVKLAQSIETPGDGWGIEFKYFNVEGLDDIGHSDKVIIVGIEDYDKN